MQRLTYLNIVTYSLAGGEALNAFFFHWCSEGYLDDEIPSVASLIQMSQESFEKLFVQMGLAKMTKSGMRFLKKEHENFVVVTHGLCTMKSPITLLRGSKPRSGFCK
jgi:hypothetical protein